MATRTEPAPSIGLALDGAARRLEAAGCGSPRLDAEVLLADALGITRTALLARRPEPLPPEAGAGFEARVARRAAREPVAYIVGRQEFYGLDLEVTPEVLIPRPETELLVDEGLVALRERDRALAVDVGTGSGCIAVALAVHAPHARVVAVDRSAAALAVARRNARRNAVAGQVRLVRGDLLAALGGPLDLVAANLPYVSSEEVEDLMPDVRRYEPRLALDGGADGTALLRPLVAQATGRLGPGGLLLLEVAAEQAGRIADLLRSTGAFSDVSTRRDLTGIERMVRGQTWTRS
jgi:release factor glutamine methyltransferase